MLKGQRWDWLAWSQYTVGEIESLICNFYHGVAAPTLVWADPSLRYTSMLLGHKQPTNKQTPTANIRYCHTLKPENSGHSQDWGWLLTFFTRFLLGKWTCCYTTCFPMNSDCELSAWLSKDAKDSLWCHHLLFFPLVQDFQAYTLLNNLVFHMKLCTCVPFWKLHPFAM